MTDKCENSTKPLQQQQQPNLSQPPLPPTGLNIAPSGAFPGSLTPGWNDPPPIPSSDSAANNRRPRLDLRKRAAYTMDGSSNSNTNTTQLLDAAAPPPAAGVLTLTTTINKPVAKVSPQLVNAPIFDYGSSNGHDNSLPARLPPLAPGNVGTAKVPVAKVPPRQK